jgi:type II secretory pathway pseudopilin PulG
VKVNTHEQRGGEGGFTIIEVVLAMFILLIGMTTIIGLLSFGAALSRTASLRSQAANAIEAVLADLEETLFPLVLVDGVEVAGEPADIEKRPVLGFPELVYSATAVPNPARTDLSLGPVEYRVDVEISWSTKGATRFRRFTTILLREVPFGERLRRKFVEGLKPEAPEEVETSPASEGT